MGGAQQGDEAVAVQLPRAEPGGQGLLRDPEAELDAAVPQAVERRGEEGHDPDVEGGRLPRQPRDEVGQERDGLVVRRRHRQLAAPGATELTSRGIQRRPRPSRISTKEMGTDEGAKGEMPP
jgi:hypothetical protein